MKILRLCYTFPTEELPSASIQQFYIEKYSKYKSIYLLRQQSSDLKFLLGIERHVFKNIFDNKNIINKFANKVALNTKLIFFFIFKISKYNLKIHVHNINYLPFAIFIKFFYKNEIYLSLGGTDLYKILKYKTLKYFLKKIDNIFVVSNDFENKLKKIGIKKIINHQNGVDHNIFYKNEKVIKKNQLLCISNIRKVKGIHFLLDSYKLFLEKNKNYELVIAGKIYYDEYYNYLKEKINELNLSNKVTFKDSLNHYEISKIINESKLTLLSSYSEGFPKVIIESMSCGVPVVSTDVGNVREIAFDCGIICPVNDVVSFAKAMNKLINDENIYKICQQNSLKKSKTFSWKNVVSIIDKTYEQT